MAATVNLPVAAKAPPAADKVQTEPAPSSSTDSGAFSRALDEQMGKKHTSDASEPKSASKKPEVSEEKQPVKEEQAKAEQSSDTGPAEPKDSVETKVQETQENPGGVDEAMAASMQTPGMQQSQLRELIALSLQAQAGSEGASDGKDLPLVAKSVPVQPGTKLAEMMKLLGIKASVEGVQTEMGSSTLDANDADTHLPPGLLLLQQRIQQQIAVQTQPQQADGETAAPSLDVAQLRGLETALQALSKASEQADGKGLEVAREQLLNRLQLIQSTQGNNSNADSQADDLPNLLKSLTQELMAGQDSKLTEPGKMMKLAFQEMLGKFGPQGQSLPATAAANPSSLTHEGIGMMSAAMSPQAQNPSMQISAPTTTVNVPVNNQAWGQAIGERLQWMVKQDMQQAEIRLNPRHLGPIEVKISMNQDQATVTFAAHHVVTRDALETAVPRLREMFGDNGLNLVDVNVSHNSDSRGQQANPDGGQHQQGSSSGWAHGDVHADEPLLTDVRTQHWVGSNRMLDTYV